jgi:hypothetical protein
VNEQRIAAIYASLAEARVPLPPDQQGPQVLLEKLREVRRWQDTVIGLSMEVMRESAGARKQVRALQALIAHSSGPDISRYTGNLHDAKDTLDDLRSLEQATRVCLSNLKTTESDIRLCSHLLDQQIKLGEIRPPEPAPMPSAHVADLPVTGIEGVFAPPTTPEARGPLPRSAPAYSGTAVAESLDIATFFSTVVAPKDATPKGPYD